MTPYFDPRWLVLLVVRTSGSQRAWALVQRFRPPFQLNPLHQLTLQNALHRQLHDSAKELADAARLGLREWHHRLAEQVFQIENPDWRRAYDLAIKWSEEHPSRPPSHGVLLHVALAKTALASDFFTLDPEMRRWASVQGLRVLPERPGPGL